VAIEAPFIFERWTMVGAKAGLAGGFLNGEFDYGWKEPSGTINSMFIYNELLN